MFEPMHLQVWGVSSGLTVRARTNGRNGCRLDIFDADKTSLNSHEYDYSRCLMYQEQMAADIASDMNIMFQLADDSTRLDSRGLLDIMKVVRDKCESRYGVRIPDSEYEVLIFFAL